MRHRKRNVRLVVDGYTRVCLTAVTVLLTVLVIGLWAERGEPCSADQGAKPFMQAAVDRKATAKAIEASTAKMDELVGLFRNGQAKVQVLDAKGAAAGGSDGRPPNKR